MRFRSKTTLNFAPLRTPSARMARMGPQRGDRAALVRRRLPFSKRSALVRRRLSFSPLGGRLLPIARFRSFSSMLLGGLCDQIVIIIVIRLVKVFSSRFTQGGGGSCRRHWKSAAHNADEPVSWPDSDYGLVFIGFLTSTQTAGMGNLHVGTCSRTSRVTALRIVDFDVARWREKTAASFRNVWQG